MLLRSTFATLSVAFVLLFSAQAFAQICPNNGAWCGPGRGCCRPGTVCAPSGGCMKPGFHDCGRGRGLCPPGTYCAPTKGCIRR